MTRNYCFVIFAALFQLSKASDLEQLTTSFIKSRSLFDSVQILIPTVNSKNELCRNHSRFYQQELQHFRLWASEMFDASSKFPTGVLTGSVYDLGNFDECVRIKVPLDDGGFSGKYCLAKFKITPLKYSHQSRLSHEIESDPLQFNMSTWEKIAVFSSDRSKGPRNEIYFSFCLPSSCTNEDLEEVLDNNIGHYIQSSDFSVEAFVEKNHCQVQRDWNYSTGSLIFIIVSATFVLVCILATIYHLMTKLDDLRKYQLPESYHKVMKCFSLACNLKRLSKKASDEDGLECIHGLKVISMCLIILGHRIMFGIGSPVSSSEYIEGFYQKVEATVLLNGPIIVDTFFNISGFLATYLLLQEFHRRQKAVNYFIIYLHRLIRITPAYAIVLFFYTTLLGQIGQGPLWNDRIGVEQERCLSSWWTNLLYFNNYYNTEKLCMFQSWYLTCDMHLFILTPLIAWFLWKKPKAGVITTCGLLFISIVLVFVKVFTSNDDGILLLYIKMLRDPVRNNQFRNVYIPTHLRASPYFVGILTGYMKYKMKISGYKMPKLVVYFGWVACVFIMEATVYSAFIFYLPQFSHGRLFSALYSSMHHFTWSLCISWIILAVSAGHGSWITPIISWRPLCLLSRITYTAFLCHGAIQLYSVAIMKTPWGVSLFALISVTASDIVLAYVAGLVLSQTFEAPIIGLEKIILGRERKPQEKRRQSDFQTNSDIYIPKVTITRNIGRY